MRTPRSAACCFLMAATAVSLVFAVIIEDVARHPFYTFSLKTQNDVRQEIYERTVRTKYASLSDADRGAFYTRYNRDSAMAASIPGRRPVRHPVSAGARGRVFHCAVCRPRSHRRAGFGADGCGHGAESSVRQPVPQAGKRIARCAGGADAQRRYGRARKDYRPQLQLAGPVSARMAEAADGVYRAGRKSIRLQLCRKLTLELLTTVCTSLITPVAAFWRRTAKSSLPRL